MRRFVALYFVAGAVVLNFATFAYSQTLTGGNLAYKSLGSSGGSILSSDGSVGTYVTIPTGGSTINFNVNATGAGSAAHMNVGIANSLYSFNVTGSSATNYTTQNVTLPAGTYFVRVERDYNNGTNNQFTVNSLQLNTVSGGAATYANDNSGGAAASNDAVNAANTYINNFRKGTMNVSVLGAAPGTPIEIKQTNSAFKWGTAVPDNISTYLPANPQNLASYTSTQTKYTAILNRDFNSVEPENAGKWGESDSASQLANLDVLLNYASSKGMRVRMHNVVWGSQQPSDVHADFTSNNTSAITSRVNSRIASYVGGTDTITGKPRATEYSELDVYNESYHTGSAGANSSTNDDYWTTMGATNAHGGAGWTASLYNQVQSTVNSVGANTKLFTNEYNVLNNNGDGYGQFYLQHIESIRNGNGPNTGAVTGIGTEWYATPGLGTGSQVGPARSYATWQNLAGQGLPLEVTEFGETAVSGADQAIGLTTAMTLAFGTPQMTGFTLWGFYDYGTSMNPMYAGSKGSVLYDNNFNITAAGTAYEALRASWTTDLNSTVNTDGTVNLSSKAFYGDYAAIINGKSYNFTYDASTNSYQIVVTPVLGDFNRDGHFTAADIAAMQSALTDLPDYESAQGMNDTYLNSIGDFNHDGIVNSFDLQGMINSLLAGQGNSSTVPEPTSVVLLALGGFAIAASRLRTKAAA
jgi:GH35 family endo-1,4-beta-xylanase